MNIISLDPFVVNRGLGCPTCFGLNGLGATGCASDQGVDGSMVYNMAQKGDCSGYLNLVATYGRLVSSTTDPTTKSCAQQYMVANQARYNACQMAHPLGAALTATTTAQSGLVPAAVTAAQNLLQQWTASQGAAGQVPAQAPAQPRQAASGWMTTKNLLMIGGGIAVIGLLIYFVRRK